MLSVLYHVKCSLSMFMDLCFSCSSEITGADAGFYEGGFVFDHPPSSDRKNNLKKNAALPYLVGIFFF